MVLKTFNWSPIVQISLQNDTNLPQPFHQQVFKKFSPIASDLACRYSKIPEQFNAERTEKELREIDDQLVINDLNLCASDAELKEFSIKISEKCFQFRKPGRSLKTIYNKCGDIAKQYRIIPPDIENNQY